MKKIIFPSMLVISLIAFAQYSENFETFDIGNYATNSNSKVYNYKVQYEMNEIEEDAAFDFNTKNYLPFDFDAHSKVGMPEFELCIEERDERFDFNTAEYLPLGFNPYVFSEIVVRYEIDLEEEDAEFDFDTTLYLPIGFNPYYDLKHAINIANR